MTPHAPNIPEPKPDLANLSEQEVASNQEAKVVPWFAGSRKVAVTWISPVWNLKQKSISPPPVAGSVFTSPYSFLDPSGLSESVGFFSFLKNASAPTTKAWFGSIAGVACMGPADFFGGLVVNGGVIWPTSRVWADGIIDLQSTRRIRKATLAAVEFVSPHTMQPGNKFLIRGLADNNLNRTNEGALPHVHSVNDRHFEYAVAAGAAYAWTDDPGGLLTKVVHYKVNALVRDGSQVWKCLVEHDGVPSKRPPNGVYWEEVSAARALSDNPFHFTVPSFGDGYLYWGTDDQVLDQVGEEMLWRNGHPPYRRQVVIVLREFLFGGRAAAPNVELILRRKPVQAIVVGAAAELDVDGQCNLVVAEAELATEPVFGGGLAVARFNKASWQGTADALAGNPALAYATAYMDRGQSLRQFLAMSQAYYDGWKRFNADGEIEAGRFLHNEAPPVFDDTNTIDFHDLIEEVALDTTGYSQTVNETVVKFQDNTRGFKPAAAKYVSGLNRQIQGEPVATTLERPWIGREAQAFAHAAEYGKIGAQPQMMQKLVVRAEKAVGVVVGGLFKLTHDAIELSVVCRCKGKTIAAPPAGRVTIYYESERGIAVLPYSPTPAVVLGTALAPATGVAAYQFVQPPPGFVSFRLTVLAARSSEVAQGLKLWMRNADGAMFYNVGRQVFWAVAGTLSQGYGVPVTKVATDRSRTMNVATLEVIGHGYASGMHATMSGFEADLIPFLGGFNLEDVVITVIDADHISYDCPGNDELPFGSGGVVNPLPDDESETLQLALNELTVQSDLDVVSDSQSLDAIDDNNLLVWLFKAADATQLEIATLRAIRLDGGAYKLKVRRGRFGTQELAFVEGDLAFIVHRNALAGYESASFGALAQSGGAATFRLQGFTSYDEADLNDPDVCPDIEFTFTDPYAPVVTWTLLQRSTGGGAFADIADFTAHFLPADLFKFGFTITDANGDLSEAKLVARLGATELTLWSGSFNASALQLKVTTFSIGAVGVWRVFLLAKDLSGRLTQAELRPVGGGDPVQLTLQTGGTLICEPLATPAGDGYSVRNVSVSLSCSTGGATIKYSVVNEGAAPGAYATYTGAIALYLGAKTIYCYATDGMHTSPVVAYTYWYDPPDPIGGGKYPP